MHLYASALYSESWRSIKGYDEHLYLCSYSVRSTKVFLKRLVMLIIHLRDTKCRPASFKRGTTTITVQKLDFDVSYCKISFCLCVNKARSTLTQPHHTFFEAEKFCIFLLRYHANHGYKRMQAHMEAWYACSFAIRNACWAKSVDVVSRRTGSTSPEW